MRYSKQASTIDDARQATGHEHALSSRISIVPFQERITCTVPETCQAIGVGRSKTLRTHCQREAAHHDHRLTMAHRGEFLLGLVEAR